MAKKKKEKKEKNPLYIFIHIPKTGGTSFISNLKEKLGEGKVCGASNLKKLSKKKKKEIKVITGHDVYYGIHKKFPSRKAKYIVFIRDPAKRRVSQYNHDMARLDEPVSFNKWYNAQIKNEQVFLLNKKFKGKKGRKAPSFANPLIKYSGLAFSKTKKILAFHLLKFFYKFRFGKKKELDNAKKLLDKCWFVTITKRLDKDLPRIFRAMRLSEDWQRYRTAKKGKKSKEKKEIEKKLTLNKKIKNRIDKENKIEKKLYEYAKRINKKKIDNLNKKD